MVIIFLSGAHTLSNYHKDFDCNLKFLTLKSEKFSKGQRLSLLISVSCMSRSSWNHSKTISPKAKDYSIPVD